jgi:ATP-binding cassette subfamily B (MDR/TAP) protein 1
MKVGLKLTKEQAPRTFQELNKMKKIHYQSVVGNLMYCMVCTRPDIAFVVGVVFQFLSNLIIAHWKANLK